MSKHKFKEDKQYKSNEEMYLLSDDEIIPEKESDMLKRLEEIPNKCCRLAFLLKSKHSICNIFRVHGEAIEVWDNTINGSEEYGVPDDLEHGWLMDKPEEGYPCSALDLDSTGADGCIFEVWERPWRCVEFPTEEQEVSNIPTCSVKFKSKFKPIYDCDGCLEGNKKIKKDKLK